MSSSAPDGILSAILPVAAGSVLQEPFLVHLHRAPLPMSSNTPDYIEILSAIVPAAAGSVVQDILKEHLHVDDRGVEGGDDDNEGVEGGDDDDGVWGGEVLDIIVIQRNTSAAVSDSPPS